MLRESPVYLTTPERMTEVDEGRDRGRRESRVGWGHPQRSHLTAMGCADRAGGRRTEKETACLDLEIESGCISPGCSDERGVVRRASPCEVLTSQGFAQPSDQHARHQHPVLQCGCAGRGCPAQWRQPASRNWFDGGSIFLPVPRGSSIVM